MAQSPPTEYQLKAAVLGHLGKFVEWPTNAFKDADSPVLLGIVGTDPFGRDLEKILGASTVSGRKWTVIRSTDPRELLNCRMLFFSGDSQERLRQLLPALSGQPILTVGESADFLEAGGMVNFVMEERKVRFEVNLTPANQAGVTFQAQLLRMARAVRRPDSPAK